MKIISVAIFAAGIFLSGAAYAQQIPVRQHHQHARINQGVRSGELTRGEAAKLRRHQRELRRQFRRDQVDGGGLTVRERSKFQRQQNRLSRNIYRQKHDRQDRD